MSVEKMAALLLNITGFAGSWLAPLCYMGMIRKFLEPRQGWLFWLLRYAACWLLFNNVVFIGDTVNILAVLPIFFLLLRAGFRCRGTEWLAVSMLFYALGSSLSAIADSGMGSIASILRWRGMGYAELFHFFAHYTYHLRMLVLIPAWLALRRLLPRERYPVPNQLWRLIGILSVLPFLGILSAVILVSPFYRPTLQNAAGGLLSLLVMLPLFFFTALALLYTASVLASFQQLRSEAELGRMNQAYYRQMEQQHQHLRRLRHDMANHLTALHALIGEGDTQAAAYLRSLQEDPGLLSPRRYCDEPVIDAVLGAKAAAMEAGNIPFTAELHLAQSIPLEGPELCALLGNLLDNAIEACAKLPPPDRQIRLSLRCDRGLFILRKSNPSPGETKRQGRRLLTSKTDPAHHGIGTESVRAIVEKYNGSVEFTEQNGTFECMLYLPVR